uniref:Exonuclease domain-containing protein n=1 Tax=Tetraselmis sp. GSL018 TaxID=582737 RepID=A0A061R761_9CHLO
MSFVKATESAHEHREAGTSKVGPPFPNPTPAPPPFPPQPSDSHFFSIDVECVATGVSHNSRAIGQIALVDQFERLVFSAYVRPEHPVASYLTPLTGLTRELLESQGVPLSQALQYLKLCLPKHAVLVGQNIQQDVSWLGLREGHDFTALRDLSGLYRIWNPKYNSMSVFGQDHLAKVLLGWPVDDRPHNALEDACKSIRLFHLYNWLQESRDRWEKAQAMLLAVPPIPSFAKRFPTFEGCCMGNRKTCKCGPESTA